MLSKKEGGRAKPFTGNHQFHVFSKSWDCPAVLVLPEGKEMVMPGEDAAVNLHFHRKMVSLIEIKCLLSNFIELNF